MTSSTSGSAGGGTSGPSGGVDAARGGRSGDAWEKAARAGYAVSGALHLVLGFLIVSIAFGSGAEADQSSALGTLGHSPLGAGVLWLAAVAFLALGGWQVADAVHDGEPADRAKAAGRGAMYLVLAFVSVSLALGSGGSNGDGQAQGFAGALVQAPAGRLLVGAIGLGILAGGAYHVVKGARKTFLEDLQATPGGQLGRGVRAMGTVGYIAKGVALAVVGVLFVVAAATADPEQAQGIDGAIDSLLGLPGGPAIVVAVGVGFAAYGVYSFARARYARM